MSLALIGGNVGLILGICFVDTGRWLEALIFILQTFYKWAMQKFQRYSETNELISIPVIPSQTSFDQNDTSIDEIGSRDPQTPNSSIRDRNSRWANRVESSIDSEQPSISTRPLSTEFRIRKIQVNSIDQTIERSNYI